jgi:hypothetical protein
MTSKSRQERRKHLQLANSGGGYGLGFPNSKPAHGQTPTVNPVMQPKTSGLNVTTQVFPSNYYQLWNPTTWRGACEQAMRMGYPIQYAAMTTWVFNSSTFIQHLFRELAIGIENSPVFLFDSKGNKIEEWSEEICNQRWFNDLRKELIYSWFWGFSGLNFDPIAKEVYKYPQQNIDPINRFLRESSYNFYDGINFSDYLNLLFVQPSTNYESFLGWMQPISRDFIQMNENNDNWQAAGARMAYPIMQVYYPENSNGQDPNSSESDKTFNPYKLDAEKIAANAKPQNAITAPYTRNPDGTINKTIEVEFTTGTQGTAGAYRVFKDFNEEKKNDIMQMILLSTLTSSVGSKGSLALGDIHMQKLEQGIKSLVTWHIDELNKDFLRKISSFYKNFPEDVKFGTNKAKQYKLLEIKEISSILNQNGKRLTTDFFIDQGISPEYIEEGPTIEPKPEQEEPKVEMATRSGLLSGLKKKVVQ